MIMDATPIVCPLLDKIYEALKRKEDEELPPPALKPPPKGVRYEFMDNTERFSTVVNADLSGKEKEKLLAVLSNHRKALGYSIQDVKGIHPSIYSHAIPIEEGSKPVIESQRRLHLVSKNVVRKDIICLLDAGVILYLIAMGKSGPLHS